MPQKLEINYLNLFFALLAFAGIVHFIFSLRFCIENYPGGYRWGSHFISDLGRTETQMGDDNSSSSLVFESATAVLGISILPFLLQFPSLFSNGRNLLRVLGTLSSFGLIGIGQTPYDQYVGLHHISLGLWIVPMGAMVILLPLILRSDGAAPDLLIYISISLLLATTLYGMVGFHSGYVVMQKVVIVLSIIWLIVVAGSAAIAARHVLSDRQQKLAAQADRYSKQLARNRKL